MEQKQSLARSNARKRKMPEDRFSLDELNQDVLERVLSWLPPSSFFRALSVCRRWSSVLSSSTFKLACSQVSPRDPWFFMVDRDVDESIVFDSSEMCWKNLSYPGVLQQAQNAKSIPVASSGGLVCFRTVSGRYIISNPVTGACRELPSVIPSTDSHSIHAIAMHRSCDNAYKLVQVSGEFPHLHAKIFDSKENKWAREFTVTRKLPHESEGCEDETAYFLSKAGDVISSNVQRSPSKQYSSVISSKGGDEIIYFLSCSGTVVACNMTRQSFSEYPRLLPVYFEYSVDLVACAGEMFAVVLSEFLESASLRVWRFCESDCSWHHVAAMPPAMSHEFYGRKADINCVGHGKLMLICVHSADFSSCWLFNLVSDEWAELPGYFFKGKTKQFLSAFSFEPRIETGV